MTQKVYKWTKKEQKMVLSLVDEAITNLNMESWVVTNRFESGPISGEDLGDGKIFVADAISTTTYEYEKIMVTWKPALLYDLRTGDASAEECVYHEIIHGLTQEIYNISLNRFATEEQCREAIERLTQRITRIICILK